MNISELIDSDNIAVDLDPAKVVAIGQNVIDQYESDDNDDKRQAKKKKWAEGQKLMQQDIEPKSTETLTHASNMKHPMLLKACTQFASRAYPGLIQGNTVARPKIIGEENEEKLEKAQRVCDFQNWQLFNETTEWEEDTDRLLHMLPFYGNMFRQIWGSTEKKRICSDIISPEKFVVPNSTKTLSDATRISLPFTLAPRKVNEKVAAGIFREADYAFDDEDSEQEEEFIEQHRWEDLDEDGIKEPYIVIVHVGSGEVASITANYRQEDVKGSDGKVTRIEPVQYFVKYTFIPATDGSFYDLGFADVLFPINEQINSVINMISDSGALANTPTGFIAKSLKIGKKGPVKLTAGSYETLNASGSQIRDGIYHMDFKGPSNALMNLLSFLLDSGRDVANLKEVLEGTSSPNQTATTTMALIEQGLKEFSAIHKRCHRSLGEELELFRKWNYILANPLYEIVLDYPADISYEDFDDAGLDFVPVSDPSVVTDMQKAAKVEWLMQWRDDPYHDQMELRKRIYELANIDGWKKLQAGQNPEVKQLQEQSQQMQQQMQQYIQQLTEAYQTLEKDRSLDESEDNRENILARAQVKEILSRAVEHLANAESKEPGTQNPQHTKDVMQIDADYAYDVQSGQIRARA